MNHRSISLCPRLLFSLLCRLCFCLKPSAVVARSFATSMNSPTEVVGWNERISSSRQRGYGLRATVYYSHSTLLMSGDVVHKKNTTGFGHGSKIARPTAWLVFHGIYGWFPSKHLPKVGWLPARTWQRCHCHLIRWFVISHDIHQRQVKYPTN